MTTIEEIATAFSSHRFAETFPYLAPGVRWVLVGQGTVDGRDAVTAACESSAADMGGLTMEFTRFLVVTGPDAVAIDAIARYVGEDGDVSLVSSCDVYEFDQGRVATMTSYAVELPAT